VHSIPVTPAQSELEKEKRRCNELYVLVKRQQKRLEGSYRDVLVENTVFTLASAHFRTGVILRRINLFTLATEQFDRAYQLLVMF
jgi:hypothetical protein